jgi:hypothetical protein
MSRNIIQFNSLERLMNIATFFSSGLGPTTSSLPLRASSKLLNKVNKPR